MGVATLLCYVVSFKTAWLLPRFHALRNWEVIRGRENEVLFQY